jgi:hypothetical protein
VCQHLSVEEVPILVDRRDWLGALGRAQWAEFETRRVRMLSEPT